MAVYIGGGNAPQAVPTGFSYNPYAQNRDPQTYGSTVGQMSYDPAGTMSRMEPVQMSSGQNQMPSSQNGMPSSQNGMRPSQNGMRPSQNGMPHSQNGMPHSQNGMQPGFQPPSRMSHNGASGNVYDPGAMSQSDQNRGSQVYPGSSQFQRQNGGSQLQMQSVSGGSQSQHVSSQTQMQSQIFETGDPDHPYQYQWPLQVNAMDSCAKLSPWYRQHQYENSLGPSGSGLPSQGGTGVGYPPPKPPEPELPRARVLSPDESHRFLSHLDSQNKLPHTRSAAGQNTKVYNSMFLGGVTQLPLHYPENNRGREKAAMVREVVAAAGEPEPSVQKPTSMYEGARLSSAKAKKEAHLGDKEGIPVYRNPREYADQLRTGHITRDGRLFIQNVTVILNHVGEPEYVCVLNLACFPSP